MKKILASFLIAITLFCNLPINVYASELGGGGYAHKWVGWSDEEKKSFCRDKLTGAILQRVGVVIQPDKWTSEAWTNAWNKHLGEIEIASGMTYDEYIMSLVSVDEDNEEFVISDSLLDSFHSVANIYIEEETGYRTHLTLDSFQYLKANVDKFSTNTQYNAYLNYCKEHPNLVFYGNMSTNNFTLNGVTYEKCFYFFEIDVTETDFTWYYSYMYGFQNEFYDKDWQKIALNRYIVTQDGNVLLYDSTTVQGNYDMHGYFYNTLYNNNPLYLYYPYESINGVASGYTPSLINITFSSSSNFLHSYKVQNLRLYDSLAELKNYSAGNRPYYITDAFKNYDSTIDNSTTITQTEIDNSVTYGDVYNYITNNYDNPDGLSEDELRAILAEYLSQINNNNSGSGSGGSGDSGGSGGGLSGFLDGLGSVGNAILAILGKLMEILGSAIELVTGAITDLITIIPNSIGELLGALFPVFPEEWIKAITLSLVLGVVVGIVRMFK